MNCRDSESLILAERDGALTRDQLAALSDHVATCPACARLRSGLVPALEDYRAAVRTVPVPDAEEAWQTLQTRLHAPKSRKVRGPLAPVIWFAAPIAAMIAAAALVFTFFTPRSVPAPSPATPSVEIARTITPAPIPLHDPSFIAGADYVEAGDPDASVMVFVDQESGWLVVWASSPVEATRG